MIIVVVGSRTEIYVGEDPDSDVVYPTGSFTVPRVEVQISEPMNMVVDGRERSVYEIKLEPTCPGNLYYVIEDEFGYVLDTEYPVPA